MLRIFAALALTLSTTLALAFDAETHTALTTTAMKARGYGNKAIEAAVAGNLKTDDDEFDNPEAHFDSETFEAGSRRMRARLVLLFERVEMCRHADALEQLGRVLHPTQDFYSHSNFVELGTPARLDLFNLSDPSPECNCHLRGPNQQCLTSGYFPDHIRPLPNKCVHAELNKDSADGSGTGGRYELAKNFAGLSSGDAVDYLEARVRERYPRPAATAAVLRFLRLGDAEGLKAARIRCPR